MYKRQVVEDVADRGKGEITPDRRRLFVGHTAELVRVSGVSCRTDLGPVSYTHLDVYKRQPLSALPGCLLPAVPVFVSAPVSGASSIISLKSL